MPSLLEQIASASAAGLRFLGNGLRIVSAKTREARLETCRGCSQYNPGEKKCAACGCFVQVKTWMPSERCPLGYWEAEN